MAKKASPRTKIPDYIRFARALHLMVLLYVSFAGWSRLVLALGNRMLLEQVGVSPGPAYLAAGGGLWGLFGLAAAGLLYNQRPMARWFLFGLELFLALTYWHDRLVFTRSAAALANWPFALLATILLLLFSGSLLNYLYRWEAVYVRN